MADSAHSNDIDRGLLTARPEAISVNVGSFSPSISGENPNIIQYDRGGINATLKLLSNVEIYGGLSENLIVPSSQGQPFDDRVSSLKPKEIAVSSAMEKESAKELVNAIYELKQEEWLDNEEAIFLLAQKISRL